MTRTDTYKKVACSCLAGEDSDGSGDARVASAVRKISPILAGMPSDFDLGAYIETILERFRNPSIRYALAQIAWDGSQKIPFRLLNTISDNLCAGRPARKLLLAVAGWMHFVRDVLRTDAEHVDPLKSHLTCLAFECDGNPVTDVNLFLQIDAVFSDRVINSPGFYNTVGFNDDTLTPGFAI